MFRRFCISLLSLAALLLCGEAVAQQPAVQARIAGLESNEEYMSLLRRDAQLQVREDSIMRVVSGMRHRLHDEPDNRQRYTQEILRLESLIFDLRTAKGRLIDRINAIEQEWVLANLNSASASEPSSAAEVTIPDSLKVRNLVYNSYFRDCLAPTVPRCLGYMLPIGSHPLYKRSGSPRLLAHNLIQVPSSARSARNHDVRSCGKWICRLLFLFLRWVSHL